jgi:hypothetical protein
VCKQLFVIFLPRKGQFNLSHTATLTKSRYWVFKFFLIGPLIPITLFFNGESWLNNKPTSWLEAMLWIRSYFFGSRFGSGSHFHQSFGSGFGSGSSLTNKKLWLQFWIRVRIHNTGLKVLVPCQIPIWTPVRSAVYTGLSLPDTWYPGRQLY